MMKMKSRALAHVLQMLLSAAMAAGAHADMPNYGEAPQAPAASSPEQDRAECEQKDRAYVAFLACSRLLRAPDITAEQKLRITERRAHASLVLFYFSDAAEDFTEVLASEPDNVEARQGRGLALGEELRFKEAAEDWGVLAAKRPDDVAARVHLGKNLYAAGSYDKAVIAYQEAIAIDQHNAVALVGLARAFDMLDQRDKADESIAAALKLNPQNTAALMARGEMAERRGDKQIAIESYMLSLKANGMQVKPRHALQRLGIETPP